MANGTYNLSVPYTQNEGRAMNVKMSQENERREAAGQEPFATVESYFEWLDDNILKSYLAEFTTATAETVYHLDERWEISSDAQRQASVDQLEPLPE